MKLLFILILVVAVISAVVLVQSGVNFSPQAYRSVPKPGSYCTRDSDCTLRCGPIMRCTNKSLGSMKCVDNKCSGSIIKPPPIR